MNISRYFPHPVSLLVLPALLLGSANAQQAIDSPGPLTPQSTQAAPPTSSAVSQFMDSVRRDDLQQMRSALASQPLLANALNTMKEPPLMYARSVPTAKLLIDSGADVNILVAAPVGDYKAPLAVLVAMNQPPMLRYLASRGANLSARDTLGNTALIRSAEAGQVESVRFLLARKLSATAKSNSGHTSLHAWAMGTQPKPTAIAQMLLARGAKVNTQDASGRTPLDRAAEYNDAASVRFLLQHQALAKLVPKNGYSALHWAAENNSVPVAQMLLSHGARINARDDDGRTPLAIANAHKAERITKYLKQRGAKP